MNIQTNEDYNIFKVQYQKVVSNADKAISFESNGKTSVAYTMYKKIIMDLENVMAINVSGCDNSIRKDVKNKKERLKWLRGNIFDCIERLGSIKTSTATLIFSIKSGCQYNTIDSTGKVTTSIPGSLELYQFPTSKEHLRGFLILSDWMTPLMQDVTPVLLTPKGVLMFLDVDRNCQVAVTLPYNILQEDYHKFIAFLSSLSLLVMDDQLATNSDTNKSTGDAIAQGLGQVTRVISNGIGIGTSKLSELINDKTNVYCQSTSATDQQVAVNDNLKTGLEYARLGSHCLVEISGAAFGMLVRSTQYLASKAAPHIKSAAENVIPTEWKKSGENGEKSTVDQIAVVTGATIDGCMRLCSSLRDGAVLFGRNVTRDASNVMTHRYGAEVGRSTEHALYSVGNIGMTAVTAMSFTKKGLIKTAAKVTGTEIVAEYNKDVTNQRMDLVKVDSGK